MSAAPRPAGAGQPAAVGTAPVQAVQPPVRQLAPGQQVALQHRAAEAAPAVKRYKKRKLPDRYVYQKTSTRNITESQIFTTLTKYEQQLDACIASKKAHLQDSLGQPTYLSKVLRLYIYNTHANQQQPGPEPPSWCLMLYGRVLDPSDLRAPAATPSLPGFPLPLHKQPLFTSVVKRIEVILEQPRSQRTAVVWERSKHVGEHRDSLEFHRVGSEPVNATVKIEMDWTPQRYTLPPRLAELVGVQYTTRPKVLQSLWRYIREQGLQSATEPALLECDDNLFAIFKQRQIQLASITERIVAVLTPMPPLTFAYTVQVSGDSPVAPHCYDIDFEQPAPLLHHTAYAPFLERISKDREIEQIEQRIATVEAKVAEHRRRRAFFLGFSQSPVDFINVLIASQARDLRVARSAQGREYEAERPSAVFRERWVEDAVMRYLNRKLAAGQ